MGTTHSGYGSLAAPCVRPRSWSGLLLVACVAYVRLLESKTGQDRWLIYVTCVQGADARVGNKEADRCAEEGLRCGYKRDVQRSFHIVVPKRQLVTKGGHVNE
jgi:hypothetical protein